ncbi:MAG TPA: hypothetical protein VFE45_19100 [Coriobacteriia bacterium]|nr:hypothetical protein [Coriobacteriia bacterium]
MLHPTSRTDGAAHAAAERIAEQAARETLAAIDLEAQNLDPTTRVALLADVTGKVGSALRAAGRDTIDGYVRERTSAGVSARTAARELGDVMSMSRSGVMGAFSRRTDRDS